MTWDGIDRHPQKKKKIHSRNQKKEFQKNRKYRKLIDSKCPRNNSNKFVSNQQVIDSNRTLELNSIDEICSHYCSRRFFEIDHRWLKLINPFGTNHIQLSIFERKKTQQLMIKYDD